MSEPTTNNIYSAAVAQFVSNIKYEDVPTQVMERLKLLILDSIGCGLYGTNLEWSQILRYTLLAVDQSSNQNLIWGTNQRLSSPHAALINGTQIQGFELDDVHRQGVMHVGAVVLPSLLSIAESKRNMNGKEFLASAIAGYEVGPRVGLCMGPEHIAQGWHSGATLGVFSSAASCARALSLDPLKTLHALGIAGTQASGLMAAQYGAMVKRMHAGRASQSGLYGALLAQNQFTGIENVFESEYGGFCSTLSRSQDRFDLTQLNNGFGEKWQTMGVALKFYSCVGSNHTTLDGLRKLREARPFTLEEVEEIHVSGSQVTMDHVGWTYVPNGLTSAQLNLSYCVATLLIEGECFVDQFTEAMVNNPERIALAKKVYVHHDEAITAKGSQFRHMVHVQVKLKNQETLDITVEAPRGSEHHFASAEDIIHKFNILASKTLPQHQIDQLVESILNLEKLDDAGSIVDLMEVA